MKIWVQRVHEAWVSANGNETGRIGRGVVAFLGVRCGDTSGQAVFLARKLASLRILDDAQGRMNRSLAETGAGVLVISQFTLYADTRHGNRPGWSLAAPAAEARPLYETVIAELRRLLGHARVQHGAFGEEMAIGMVHDGPVSVELLREAHE